MWKNDPTSTIVIMCKIDITAEGHEDLGVYLRRWYIFRCPLGGVMLHKIVRHDVDRHLHNHPWAFTSIVLKGGYWEEYLDRDGIGERHIKRINYRPHGTFHKIEALTRWPTWTLVFTGRKRSSWGFRTENGFVPWREYPSSKGYL